MQTVFSIDGRSYNVTVPDGGLERSFEVLDTEQAKRLLSGRMSRSIIGTYYNYTLSLETKDLDAQEYDELYETLSAPVDSHIITLPYGQGTIVFEAYVTRGRDKVKRMKEGFNLWGGLSINFIAMEPRRLPE